MKLNQKGIISVEFLFSIVISSILITILFCMTFTLSVVEIAQYFAFSVSRAHIAGHIDQLSQEQAAKDKYQKLISNPVLGVLFKNDWFELTGPEIRGGGQNGSVFNEYPKSDTNLRGAPPVGVRLQFNAKLLSMKFALLGSTDSEDQGFKSNITALLFREPSMAECQSQMKASVRYQNIISLDQGRFSIANGVAEKYVAMEDNGC